MVEPYFYDSERSETSPCRGDTSSPSDTIGGTGSSSINNSADCSFHGFVPRGVLRYADLVFDDGDNLLGQGAFGAVFRGSYLGLPVAVKQAKIESTEEFEREASVLLALRHPSVVLLIGYCFQPSPSLVFEYMDMGSLASLLHRRSVRIEPAHIDHAIRSIANGLWYLHSLDPPILHKDVKPDNILVANRWTSVKLADFGISSMEEAQGIAIEAELSCVNPMSSGAENQSDYIDHDGYITNTARDDGGDYDRNECDASIAASSASKSPQLAGPPAYGTTVNYRAPEMTRGAATAAADVFSFGILMWECLSRKIPYSTFTSAHKIREAVLRQERPAIPSGTPQWRANLISRCWAHIPEARPSMASVVAELESRSPAQPKRTSSRDMADSKDATAPAVGKKSLDTANVAVASPENTAESYARRVREENFSRSMEALEGGQLYVSKSSQNIYARMYNAVLIPEQASEALEIIEGIVSGLKGIASCQGSVVMYNPRFHIFYGLVLYGDEEGLRASDSLAARSPVSGREVAIRCASVLYRDVLECVPVFVKPEGQTRAHLCCVDIRQNSPGFMEQAMKAYVRDVAPRLAALDGFGGTLATTQYNKGRVYLFNLFRDQQSLDAFIRSDLIARSTATLAQFVDGPMSFDTFNVLSQIPGSQPITISKNVRLLAEAMAAAAQASAQKGATAALTGLQFE